MAKDAELDTLDAVRRPIETANGLQNAHYTDPDMFTREKHAVLMTSWAGLAVTDDVPEIGDAKPVEFLGIPLLLIRDRTGQVRVFQNICRHRGMILVSEAKKIEGAIRCPYHSWCYGTDGALVSTPHVGGPGHNTHEAIDKSTLGLIEVRSHIWFNTVFINLDGNAAPFEEVHADLLSRWLEFDQPMYHGGADSRFTLEVATNWKLAVENYCESYHLPWVHPGLNSYSRLEDHYNINEKGKYSGQGTLVYRQMKGEDGTVFPDFEGLSEKWETGGEYLTVYPNVLLGVQRDHAFIIVLEPKSHDSTDEHVHIYYAAPDIDDALRARNSVQWREVFEEDIFVVEGMQKGRAAPGFDGGRFSPAMDGPTHCFHDWVAGKIASYDAG
ncbi:aromatic ring-hydroxylating dioxygenase subunit alpha [Cognatiyoonia sp. IB215446]|uniref:aromatic ring-hydroxylating oxygenase subunit alpha n=1 Tax=Cognatiyoonia sp. IB215446 TaxID=3097355 RepID=UPI002A13973B|nr:aromatic ring-hydroxylating dioxygenase subunit alpha [Cognatiyoonia sp. IB215446]MDX8349683.1 aromatic ring-hydroxylating dioxygenase subunit alpha [Cognatiyoonia sp. IB215446]